MGMKTRCSRWYRPAERVFNPKEQRDMRNVPVFVGLDYHQDSVQVCILDQDGNERFNRSLANDWQKIDAAVKAQGKLKRAAIEACCGAADLAQELVDRA